MSTRTADMHKTRIRAMLVLVLAICFMSSNFVMAYAVADVAGANAALAGFMSKVKTVYEVIQKIAAPAAVVALSWGAITCLGGNTKNMEQGFQIIKYTLFSLAGIWLFPLAFREFAQAIQSTGLVWTPAHLAPVASPSPT